MTMAVPHFSIEPFKALSPASRSLPMGQGGGGGGKGFASSLATAASGGGLNADKIGAATELMLNQGLMDILGEGEPGQGGGLNGAMNTLLLSSLLGGGGGGGLQGLNGLNGLGGATALAGGGLPEGLGELAALAQTFPGGVQGMVDALRRLATDPAAVADKAAAVASPDGPALPAAPDGVAAPAPGEVPLPVTPSADSAAATALAGDGVTATADAAGLARSSGLRAYGRAASLGKDAAQASGQAAAVAKPDLFSHLLGRISARFESAGDPAAVGYDRVGGTSYGMYQLSSRTGTMDQFIGFLEHRRPDWAAVLDTAGPANTGSTGGAMPAAWRALADQDPQGFARLQHDFISQHHFLPAASRIKDLTGLDLSANPALAEVLWSTAVQHGAAGAASIVSGAAEAVGPAESPGFAASLVKEVYKRRAGQFGSSEPAVQDAVRSRLQSEREAALSLLRVGGTLDSEV